MIFTFEDGFLVGLLVGVFTVFPFWIHNLQHIVSKNRKTYEDLMRKYGRGA